jgi:hypothetical protein
MDKPDLLSAIQHNHPTVSLDLIQHLAQIEINRQIDESIKGMLHKKPLAQLENVVAYREVCIKSVSMAYDLPPAGKK